MLPQRFRVPLAPFGSKEITSVNVYGAGQAWNGVGNRVNDVRSKRLCIFFAKRSRTRRLDLAIRKPTPKNVVLAARVYANDGPHLVVVGPDRHSWPPDDIENGEVRRMINFCTPERCGSPNPLRTAPGSDTGTACPNCRLDSLKTKSPSMHS